MIRAFVAHCCNRTRAVQQSAVYSAALKASKIFGSRIVNVDPRPRSLSFAFLVLRRRDFSSFGGALERRLIALPWLNKAHHSGLGCVVHHSKFGAPTS
jgi:hypothetical protein